MGREGEVSVEDDLSSESERSGYVDHQTEIAAG